MRVFLTGADGWIGSAVARELVDAGHAVVGLVRSKRSGEALAAAGVTPLLGSLTDLDVLRQGAGAARGVIRAAFGLDFSKHAERSREDRRAIETFGEVFAGADRPIVVTSGLGLLSAGDTFTEDSRPAIIAECPRASEQTAFALAERGLRASVVRPARSVHGPGERHGFVPLIAGLAREKGFPPMSATDGIPGRPCIGRMRRVFRLALDRGARNEAFHAVAEGLPLRLLAEAIGRRVGVPARSLTPEEAEVHFGRLAVWVTGSGPVSSERTRSVLGWEPKEIGLISDIDRPAYHG